jgi:Na(+)-translocating NADH:ubiquinone oxidoreductase A subunit
VLGEPFPFGHSAINVGVVILDSQAVVQAYEAVTAGRPAVERILALSGPGFATPTHVRVRVGTRFEHVVAGRLKDVPVRLVRNSLLSGIEVQDRAVPVTRNDGQLVAALTGAERVPFAFARPGLNRDSWTRAFLARVLPLNKQADTNLHGDERPCINCGFCSRVCPVRIIPHLITRIARRVGVSERLVNYGVFNCIDCNLCTFVCPSKIPLAQQMKETKERLLEVGCDNSSCILPRFDLRGVEEYKGVKSIR